MASHSKLTKGYDSVAKYNATCGKCKKEYKCKGHVPCPGCGSIHRVTFLRDLGGEPVAGVETC